MPGRIQELWHAIISSVADELYATAGRLVVRTTAPYAPGDTSLVVESTYRWPPSGSFACAGQRGRYASKTATSLDGVTLLDGTPGLPVDIPAGSTVIDLSQNTTLLDALRRSFLINYAEGVDLDIIGVNYGLTRPRGMAYETWRALLRVLPYLPAQTPNAIRDVMDAVYGPGQYDVVEYDDEPDIVYVTIPPTLSATHRGKTFLCGGEAQSQVTPTTVTASHPPAVVYGVYDASDPERRGTNYALLDVAVTTSAAQPTRLASAAEFLPSDNGKAVIFDDGTTLQTWRIAGVVSASAVTLIGPTHRDGQALDMAPDRFRATHAPFARWMVGHNLEILSGPNAGTYPIAEYLTPYQIRVTGALVTDTDVEWRLVPKFGDGSGTVHIPRATIAGNTITTPVAMPTDVILDYATAPSAQILASAIVNGEAQYPAYLGDGGQSQVESLLDEITASGVRVIAIME